MKRIIQLLTAAAAVTALAAAIVSCHKNIPDTTNNSNPTEYSLKGADFDLICLDGEHGFSKDSIYVFEGIWRDGHFWFGREKLDTMQLNITPKDNSITLKVSSEAAGFEGVNASSSSRCINIVPDGNDHTSYHLEWVEEGESRITLWCGEGSAKREISFIATSRKEIPMEGIATRVNGELIMMNYYPNGGTFSEPLDHKGRFLYGYKRLDNEKHVSFEIVGPVPLNATTAGDDIYIICDHFGMKEYASAFIGYIKELKNIKPEELEKGYWLPMEQGVYSSQRTRIVRHLRYTLYEDNLKLNPEFRWFTPLEIPLCCWTGNNDKVSRYMREQLNAPIEQYPQEKEVGAVLWSKYRGVDSYKLRPADLRERFTWVWPTRHGQIFGMVFTIGEGTPDPDLPEIKGPTVKQAYDFCLVFKDQLSDGATSNHKYLDQFEW